MDGDIRMGDDYYRHSVGSPEHYAAYERQFIALNGVDAAISGDPEASYEIDHAYALAYDRMVEEGYEAELAELREWWRERGNPGRNTISTIPRTGWAMTGGSPASP